MNSFTILGAAIIKFQLSLAHTQIQDGAVKCKHCKEWLSKQDGNADHPAHESEEGVNEAVSTTSEQIGAMPTTPMSTVSNDEEDANKYKPVKPKGKYGWGWFMFMATFANSHNPVISTHVAFYNPAVSSIENLSFIPLLAVYFWFRNRFLKKIIPMQKSWPAGLKAGIITYFIWGVLIVPTAIIIDTKIKSADIKAVSQKYYDKGKNMQQEELQLINSLIEEPKTIEDLKFNLSQVAAILTLVEQKHDISHAMFNDFKEIYGKDGKKGKKQIDAIERLEATSNRLFETSKNAWEALKKYYTTHNEVHYDKYTALEQEAENLRSEYQELSEGTFK